MPTLEALRQLIPITAAAALANAQSNMLRYTELRDQGITVLPAMAVGGQDWGEEEQEQEEEEEGMLSSSSSARCSSDGCVDCGSSLVGSSSGGLSDGGGSGASAAGRSSSRNSEDGEGAGGNSSSGSSSNNNFDAESGSSGGGVRGCAFAEEVTGFEGIVGVSRAAAAPRVLPSMVGGLVKVA